MIQGIFEIAQGDFLVMKKGGRLRIANIDDKYLYTDDGKQFKRNHPDIVGIERHDIEKALEEEAVAPIVEEPEPVVVEEPEIVAEEVAETVAEEVAEEAAEEQPKEEEKKPAKKKSSSKKKK